MYDFNELIGSIKLSKGAHPSPEQGMCAMELVSWLEGLPFSDEPKCTCPVIADYVRVVNDNMNQAGRDKLLCYLPKIVGTVSKEHELKRAEFFAWQAIREFAPNALSLAGLHEHAKVLVAANSFGEAKDAADFAVDAAYATAGKANQAEVYIIANAAARATRMARAAATNAAQAQANAHYAVGYSSIDAAGSAAKAAIAYAVAAENGLTHIFTCLEGALAIGPQSPGFSRDVTAALDDAKKLIAV